MRERMDKSVLVEKHEKKVKDRLGSALVALDFAVTTPEMLEWRHAGFTGSREGMTHRQQKSFRELLKEIRGDREIIWGRHGDCVGSDEQAHDIFRQHDYRVIIHPPDEDEHRAFCEGAYSVLQPKPYLKRDQRIVDLSTILLATPNSFEEVKRGSGTWATIRMAMKVQCPVRIIFPDGSWTSGRKFYGD